MRQRIALSIGEFADLDLSIVVLISQQSIQRAVGDLVHVDAMLRVRREPRVGIV